MKPELVPLASVETDTAKTVRSTPDAFCCIRASRRLRLAPKYGEGGQGGHEVEVRYLWTGAPGAPTVVVQGGISASRQVCDTEDCADAGWWSALVGPGKAIDLTKVRVLSIEWLSAADVGAVSVSSEDQADAIAALMDALRIGRIEAFVGSSYGAMAGLAFAARHGRRVGRLVALAGAHRPHPLATAQRAIQREILRLGQQNGCADQAISLARQLAMTTYRGTTELAQRFGGEPEFADGRYRLPVEGWLEHAGRKFVGRVDPARYLSLSESIDLHRVDPAAVCTPTTLIGFASDRLVPLSDLCELQRSLAVPASLEVLESLYGHDGFLKEAEALTPVVRAAVRGDSSS